MREKLIVLLWLSIYTTLFVIVYVDWLVPNWGYLGVGYIYKGFLPILQVFIFSIAPVIWIPISVIRPTALIYWILFLFTYIPMVVGLGLHDEFDYWNTLELHFFLFFGFFILGMSYFIKPIKISIYTLENKFFWLLINALTLILISYVVYFFKDTMKFVSPFSNSLYDQRFSARDATGESVLVGYCIMWLSGCFFPFLLSYGLIFKSFFKVFFGILGQFVLYMIAANKAFIFSILFILFIYFILLKTNKVGLLFLKYISAFIAVLLILNNYYDNYESVTIFLFPLMTVFILRFMAISTINIVTWSEFFQNHQHTYYSHVNIVGKIIQYPYGELQLGQVIGDFFYNSSDLNFNANFFITDGIAAIGNSGMILIGLVCAVLFYFIDCVSKNHNIKFTILLFSYSAINLSNVSLFVSFFSGGIFFLIVLLLFSKTSEEEFNIGAKNFSSS